MGPIDGLVVMAVDWWQVMEIWPLRNHATREWLRSYARAARARKVALSMSNGTETPVVGRPFPSLVARKPRAARALHG